MYIRKERIDRGVKARTGRHFRPFFRLGPALPAGPPGAAPADLAHPDLDGQSLLAEGPPLHGRFCPAGHQLGLPGFGRHGLPGAGLFFRPGGLPDRHPVPLFPLAHLADHSPQHGSGRPAGHHHAASGIEAAGDLFFHDHPGPAFDAGPGHRGHQDLRRNGGDQRVGLLSQPLGGALSRP